MKYHWNNEYRECENRKEEKAYLENKSAIMMFKTFIRDECQCENKHEWPAHRKRSGAEIINKKGAKKSAKKPLEDVNEPKMEPLGILAAACVLIFGEVYKENTRRYYKKVNAHPHVFPKEIYAPQGKGVKNKSADERD
jgi:hypothetical protein